MRSQRGLTLIEVLVALSILSIAMLALIPLFGMSVKTNASSSQLATANTLAREKLEELIGYPSTDPRLSIPSGSSTADKTNNTDCANDLPVWYNPTTGAISSAVTTPGLGWYPYPCTRTYTVQAFIVSDLANAKSSTASDESTFNGDPKLRYYDVKLVTVTVQPASGPFPGLRRTSQSSYVMFRRRL